MKKTNNKIIKFYLPESEIILPYLLERSMSHWMTKSFHICKKIMKLF